jgi:hypothetical protein
VNSDGELLLHEVQRPGGYVLSSRFAGAGEVAGVEAWFAGAGEVAGVEV